MVDHGTVKVAVLDCHDVKGAKPVEQKDQSQDNSDDIEQLAFDEHAHDVVNDIEDEPRDK
jgi:hypothetical protein